MKKGLKKLVAAGMTVVSLMSTGIVSSAKKPNYIGTLDFYNNRDVALTIAEKLENHSYTDMPDDIEIGGHWCAAFTKVLYGWEDDPMCAYVDYTVQKVLRDGGTFCTDKHQRPQLGDLAIYDEDDDPDYDHIGIIIGCKQQDDGTWYVKTIEGNAIRRTSWDPNLSKAEYCDIANNTPFNTRKAEKFSRYKQVRQNMIVGWLSPVTTSKKGYIIGDLNGDGNVNVADMVLMKKALDNRNNNNKILQYSLYPSKFKYAEFYYRCDVNKDGEMTNKDYELIKDYVLSK